MWNFEKWQKKTLLHGRALDQRSLSMINPYFIIALIIPSMRLRIFSFSVPTTKLNSRAFLLCYDYSSTFRDNKTQQCTNQRWQCNGIEMVSFICDSVQLLRTKIIVQQYIFITFCMWTVKFMDTIIVETTARDL